MTKQQDQIHYINYQIKVKEKLDTHRETWFDGMTITSDKEGTSLIEFIRDQAALHGLLNQVRDLGLTLLSVNRIAPNQEELFMKPMGKEE